MLYAYSSSSPPLGQLDSGFFDKNPKKTILVLTKYYEKMIVSFIYVHTLSRRVWNWKKKNDFALILNLHVSCTQHNSLLFCIICRIYRSVSWIVWIKKKKHNSVELRTMNAFQCLAKHSGGFFCNFSGKF